MDTIHLIHGIRDTGEHTIKPLGELLARDGFNVMPRMLPRTHTWHAASSRDTRLLARSLMHQMQPGDHIIAHSHGCGITMAVLEEMGLNFSADFLSKIVMLSPALNRNQDFHGLPFDNLLCIHNPFDIAIWAGSLLPFHPFGLAGALGIKTFDPRVRNEARPSFVGPFNHTDPYFRMPYIEDMAQRIGAFIAED